MAIEYDPASVVVVTRAKREKERLEASVAASEQNFKKTFADLFRQDVVKRNLALDAQAATKDPNRRENTRNVDVLRDRGIYRGYESDETITGFEQWLKD